MRVAVVHDWLFHVRGGERLLDELLQLLQEHSISYELFAMFHRPYPRAKEFLPPNSALLGVFSAYGPDLVTTSVLNRLPGLRRFYRALLPLYPLAIRDLSRRLADEHAEKPFDLVISVSHCAVKNIRAPKGVPHLSYCLTPARYLWDQFAHYFPSGVLGSLIHVLMSPLRWWDRGATKHVTQLAGISHFVCERISRCYGREASTVYPPVRTDWIEPGREGGRRGEFLVVNALVPYKRTDLIVEAFNQLGLKLKIVGRGPERERLIRMAEPNVSFVEQLSNQELAEVYRNARALVFAAEEDFGMIPVEIMAAGRPVIALARGGALETISTDPAKPTGVLFDEQSVEGIIRAVTSFIDREEQFLVRNCIAQAAKFSVSNFRLSFAELLFSCSSGQVAPFAQGGRFQAAVGEGKNRIPLSRC